MNILKKWKLRTARKIEKYVNSKQTKYLQILFEEYLENCTYHLINNVKFRKFGNVLKIKIVTYRPGILIGKHGIHIENIKKRFFKEFGLTAEIFLKEDQRWNYCLDPNWYKSYDFL